MKLGDLIGINKTDDVPVSLQILRIKIVCVNLHAIYLGSVGFLQWENDIFNLGMIRSFDEIEPYLSA